VGTDQNSRDAEKHLQPFIQTVSDRISTLDDRIDRTRDISGLVLLFTGVFLTSFGVGHVLIAATQYHLSGTFNSVISTYIYSRGSIPLSVTALPLSITASIYAYKQLKTKMLLSALAITATLIGVPISAPIVFPHQFKELTQLSATSQSNLLADIAPLMLFVPPEQKTVPTVIQNGEKEALLFQKTHMRNPLMISAIHTADSAARKLYRFGGRKVMQQNWFYSMNMAEYGKPVSKEAKRFKRDNEDIISAMYISQTIFETLGILGLFCMGSLFGYKRILTRNRGIARRGLLRDQRDVLSQKE
jgi:hypothetical protein